MTLFSIFRIPRSWLRIKYRNERRARDSAHVWTRSLRSLVIFVHSTFANLFFFIFFLFFVRLGNLEASCKFQRALHLKKEDRSGPKICCEEGYNEWLLIFWIFFWGLKNGKSLLLLYHYARFSSNCCYVDWLFAC